MYLVLAASTAMVMVFLATPVNSYPTDASPAVLFQDEFVRVAQKSKRKRKSRMTHAQAMKLCRKKYGWSNVQRVRIRADGMVICYVDVTAPSAGGRKNYNQ